MHKFKHYINVCYKLLFYIFVTSCARLCANLMVGMMFTSRQCQYERIAMPDRGTRLNVVFLMNLTGCQMYDI